jgi:hypothetical protein
LRPASAGQVYKCKGPKGEVTFTNVACPTQTKSIEHYGSFAPTPDSPDQTAAAAREADRIHEQQLIDQAPTERTASDVQSTQSAIDRAAEGKRSAAGSDARAERQRKNILEEHERWRGTRLDDHPELDVPTDRHHVDRAGRQRAPVIQNCNTSPGGAITCFGSDGSIANGQVNPGGEATMFGTGGSIQQLHGVSGKASTFCDPNGFCN